MTGDGTNAVFGGYGWLHEPLTLATDDFPWPGVGEPTDLLNPDARRHLMPGVYRGRRYEGATLGVLHLAGADALGRRRWALAYLTVVRYVPHLLTRLGSSPTPPGSPCTRRSPTGCSRPVCSTRRRPAAPARYPERAATPRRRRPAAGGDHMASATPVPQRRPARRIAAIRTDQLRDVRDDREALLRPLLDRNRVTDLLARPADPVGDPAAAAVAYLVDVNAWLQRHHISLT